MVFSFWTLLLSFPHTLIFPFSNCISILHRSFWLEKFSYDSSRQVMDFQTWPMGFFHNFGTVQLDCLCRFLSPKWSWSWVKWDCVWTVRAVCVRKIFAGMVFDISLRLTFCWTGRCQISDCWEPWGPSFIIEGQSSWESWPWSSCCRGV